MSLMIHSVITGSIKTSLNSVYLLDPDTLSFILMYVEGLQNYVVQRIILRILIITEDTLY